MYKDQVPGTDKHSEGLRCGLNENSDNHDERSERDRSSAAESINYIGREWVTTQTPDALELNE
jgi:hypothetical protein